MYGRVPTYGRVPMMLIEQLMPQVVMAKDSLQQRLAAEARERGVSVEELDELLSVIPLRLLNSDCFLDRLTELWRYEFGEPLSAGTDTVYGTHMWPPVRHLLAVTKAAHQRLSEADRRRYLERLANPKEHERVLVEFIPMLRLVDAENVKVEFGFRTGAGNRDVDWRFVDRDGRILLVEVKRRMADLRQQLERSGRRDDHSIATPEHEASIMFRKIEEKFCEVAPDIQLQGVWIVTELQQEESEFSSAFAGLNARKVHFAVIGDWAGGIALLTRREQDRGTILGFFGAETADRYFFKRSGHDPTPV